MVELETIKPHAHYTAPGQRADHHPGDRYTVKDAPGLTATEYAAVVVALGVARLAPPLKKSKAVH